MIGRRSGRHRGFLAHADTGVLTRGPAQADGFLRAFGHAAALACELLNAAQARGRAGGRARRAPVRRAPRCRALSTRVPPGTLPAWSAGAYTVQQDALGELVKKCQPYLYSADFSSCKVTGACPLACKNAWQSVPKQCGPAIEEEHLAAGIVFTDDGESLTYV